jgi:hypothetical protein
MSIRRKSDDNCIVYYWAYADGGRMTSWRIKAKESSIFRSQYEILQIAYPLERFGQCKFVTVIR